MHNLRVSCVVKYKRVPKPVTLAVNHHVDHKIAQKETKMALRPSAKSAEDLFFYLGAMVSIFLRLRSSRELNLPKDDFIWEKIKLQ